VRIVALQPFAIDILDRFGIGWDLVGGTHRAEIPPNAQHAAVLTRPPQHPFRYLDNDARRLAEGLTHDSLDVSQLKSVVPDIILADIREDDKLGFISWAENYLTREVGRTVKVRDISVGSLEAVYQLIEELGALVGNRVEARRLASTIKAQLMHWADSFFDRCRGKQVAVISQVDPIVIEGRWFSDLIRMFGGKPIERAPQRGDIPLKWSDLVAARVDVIIVAPEHGTITQSVQTLSVLQTLPGWEDVPAVKRGEVIFAPGSDLYRPGPRFLKGAAIVLSAMAGLDSGYITGRDEYYKVRYLELHRHRFL
jgi:iron complex transport system substrate-binding protein